MVMITPGRKLQRTSQKWVLHRKLHVRVFAAYFYERIWCQKLHFWFVVNDDAGGVAWIIVAVKDGPTCIVGSVPPIPWMSAGRRLNLAGRLWPVVEVHALHGEGVGASLLVLQDPRLHQHCHLRDEESHLVDWNMWWLLLVTTPLDIWNKK